MKHIIPLLMVMLIACGSDAADGATDVADISATDGVHGELPGDFEDISTQWELVSHPDPPNQLGPFSAQELPFTISTGSGDPLVVSTVVPLAPGPFPVVIFTHGFQLSPSDFRSYGEHLASWGFVVLLPKLPGTMFDPATHAELRESLAGLLDWVEMGPLDLEHPLYGAVDGVNIGVAGHSMGGKLSFLLAATDQRVDAVFGVDPVDAGPPIAFDPADYPSVTPELMSDILVPLIALGEVTNSEDGPLGPACAPSSDNFRQYYDEAQSPALEIEIAGANHMSFLDNPDCGLPCLVCPAGTDNPALTRQLVHKYLVAFFKVVLQNDLSYKPYLTGQPMDADVAAGLVTIRSKNEF